MKISENVYLATVPFAGTAAVYLFEMGFCRYHGIPTSLIELTPSRVVIASLASLCAAWVIHTYVALALAFIFRRKMAVFRFVGLGMLSSLLPFLFLVATGGNQRMWVGFGLFFVLPFVIGFIPAVIRAWSSGSFLKAWLRESASVIVDSPRSKTDGLEGIIDTPGAWIAVSFVLSLLCFGVGHRYAESFAFLVQVLSTDPSRALVVVYGDHWIFRPVEDLKKGAASGGSELLILSGAKAEELTLGPSETRFSTQ